MQGIILIKAAGAFIPPCLPSLLPSLSRLPACLRHGVDSDTNCISLLQNKFFEVCLLLKLSNILQKRRFLFFVVGREVYAAFFGCFYLLWLSSPEVKFRKLQILFPCLLQKLIPFWFPCSDSFPTGLIENKTYKTPKAERHSCNKEHKLGG